MKSNFASRAVPCFDAALGWLEIVWRRCGRMGCATLLLGVAIARAELLVLNSGGSGTSRPAVWRFDPATGMRLGVFGHATEAYYRIVRTATNEVCVTGNTLGDFELQQFDLGGRYQGTAFAGNGAGFAGVVRGPGNSFYSAALDPVDERWRIMRHDGAGDTVFIENGAGGLTTPVDMLPGSDGYLYVADRAVGILRFDALTGAFADVVVPNGRGGMPEVSRMIFGPEGWLYVANETTNVVYRFDPRSGAFVDTFVSTGSGGLRGALGMAFGPDGNLYVVSRDSAEVLRYSGASGAFLGVAVRDPQVRAPVDIVFTTPEGA